MVSKTDMNLSDHTGGYGRLAEINLDMYILELNKDVTDPQKTEELGKLLMAFIAAKKPRQKRLLVVDFHELEQLTDEVLKKFVAAHQAMGDDRMVIAHVPAPIQQALKISHMDKYFNYKSDLTAFKVFAEEAMKGI